MKMFEDTRPPQDAAALVLALFREFETIDSYVQSQFISPSSLECQVACALKLQGIPTEPQKESFQSRCFADNGEDRHRRIQAFLSKTPYWVNVKDYVEANKLDIRVITNEERIATTRAKNLETIEKLEKKWQATALILSDEEKAQKAADEKRIAELQEWLAQPDEFHVKKMYDDDPYETLLQHKTLPVRFKCDGMLLIEGNYYILEIKTERGQANAFRTSYDPKHQKQGVCYATLLATDRILWLYEGRELLEQKPFVQIVRKEEKQQMKQYLQQIVDNKDSIENLLKDEKGCAYCVYKKHCKAYFKELKKKEKQNG